MTRVAGVLGFQNGVAVLWSVSCGGGGGEGGELRCADHGNGGGGPADDGGCGGGGGGGGGEGPWPRPGDQVHVGFEKRIGEYALDGRGVTKVGFEPAEVSADCVFPLRDERGLEVASAAFVVGAFDAEAEFAGGGFDVGVEMVLQEATCVFAAMAVKDAKIEDGGFAGWWRPGAWWGRGGECGEGDHPSLVPVFIVGAVSAGAGYAKVVFCGAEGDADYGCRAGVGGNLFAGGLLAGAGDGAGGHTWVGRSRGRRSFRGGGR